MHALSMSSLIEHRQCLDVALAERDQFTENHCSRVEILSMLLGQALGLPSLGQHHLRAASRLHDVGKIGIPDSILLKPGRFEPGEWEIMKTHSVLGQRICDAIPHESSAAIGLIVRHHHEFFDGRGYPDGLAGSHIPICARIISIADCFDAITDTRPYHSARSPQVAMEIIESEVGYKYDPFVFELFQEVMRDQVRAAHDNQ